MDTLAFALAVKALFLIVLFGAARLTALLIHKLMPDGRVKRFLFFDDGKYP